MEFRYSSTKRIEKRKKDQEDEVGDEGTKG
jgi:hypothetical protein